MQSLHCLGVGDGAASTGRNHSAYLYSIGGERILIDSGEPVGRTLKMADYGPDAIDRIFISHLHSDHTGGLMMLLQGFWLDQRRKPLSIHMPNDGIEPFKQMLRAGYLFEEILPFKIIFHALKAGVAVKSGAGQNASVSVTPIATSHLESKRKSFQARYPGDYSAFAFLVEGGDVRIGHSADIGAPSDLDPLLKQPLDLLVCELAHFTPKELFGYLRGQKIKKLLLTHVDRCLWDAGIDELRRTAETALAPIDVSFATDGRQVQF